jgi:hypothetical protein
VAWRQVSLLVALRSQLRSKTKTTNKNDGDNHERLGRTRRVPWP